LKSSRAGRSTRAALIVLSLLLLAAHFYRSGAYVLVVAAIALTGLTFVAQPWARRVLGLALLCGTFEWLRTAWGIAALRASMGLPYTRLLVILGGVAAFTLFSAYLAWRSGLSGGGPETD
jgi:hypothetical protein